MERLIAGAGKLGLQLKPVQLEQFNIYYRELVDWNRRLNLTAITGYEEVQIRHFLDSLTVSLAWQLPPTDVAFRLIDIGTGAGMPGIPLRIVFPRIRLALLDATAKKADFLHYLKRELGMEDIEVIVGRAEEIAHQPQYRERFDVAVSRAVASLATLVELALPFCSIGGSAIAQKKGGIGAEIDRAERAIGLLGGKLRQVKSVELEEFHDERRLIIIDKLSETPARYPRRPGIPAKRPL